MARCGRMLNAWFESKGREVQSRYPPCWFCVSAQGSRRDIALAICHPQAFIAGRCQLHHLSVSVVLHVQCGLNRSGYLHAEDDDGTCGPNLMIPCQRVS